VISVPTGPEPGTAATAGPETRFGMISPNGFCLGNSRNVGRHSASEPVHSWVGLNSGREAL